MLDQFETQLTARHFVLALCEVVQQPSDHGGRLSSKETTRSEITAAL